MSDLRLGIVGTGHMARQMLAAARVTDGIAVSAILSRDLARARSLNAGAEPFDDPERFIAAVDALYVATPPAHHAAIVEPALRAKRPVLCEKPMTPSEEETRRLIALAQETGTLLMETIWTLTLPAYRAIAEHGGDAKRLAFDFSYPLEADAGSHYFDPETGGVVLDRGVYGYAAAMHCLGPVAEQAVFVQRDATGLDRSAEIRLTHEGGGVSILTLSFDHLGSNRLDLSTGSGVVSLVPSLGAEAMWWKPHFPSNSVGGGGLKERLKNMPAMRRLARHRQQQKFEFRSYGRSLYSSVLEEFRDSVRAGRGESPVVPLSLSAEIARLTEEARRQ